MSEKINKQNETRQYLDKSITDEALEMLHSNEILKGKKSTVLYKQGWHKGVVGIVASRLIETYYKPTIILTESNGMATGSARSVDGFDLYQAIDACSDLLCNFGGHKHAAGLSMKIEHVEEFSVRFEEYARQNLTDDQMIPKINIDQYLSFSEITPRFFSILKRFAPFGPGNMSPVFVSEHIHDTGGSRLVGKTEEHLRLELADDHNNKFFGIGFFKGEFIKMVKENPSFNVCYSIEENEFNGQTSLQLRIRDIQTAI